jgi:hypothetical protein
MFAKHGAHIVLAMFISLMIAVSLENPLSLATPAAIAQEIDRDEKKGQFLSA